MKNIEFTKEEITLLEHLVESHIEMLEVDAKVDEIIKADLALAENIHYKILKYFRNSQ